ncbi:hypothetical protein JX266_009978 [Neoarthrinium moseri]|nr:hypothetical protein JX266_009978 [Neoarthrinium moseri]
MECWSGDILAAIYYFNRRPQGGRKYVFKFIRPHLAGSPPSFCDKKMLSLNADQGKPVGVMDRAASGRGSRQRAKLVRKIGRLMNKLAAAVNPAEAANIEEQKDDLTGEVFGCLDFSAAKMPMLTEADWHGLVDTMIPDMEMVDVPPITGLPTDPLLVDAVAATYADLVGLTSGGSQYNYTSIGDAASALGKVWDRAPTSPQSGKHYLSFQLVVGEMFAKLNEFSGDVLFGYKVYGNSNEENDRVANSRILSVHAFNKIYCKPDPEKPQTGRTAFITSYQTFLLRFCTTHNKSYRDLTKEKRTESGLDPDNYADDDGKLLEWSDLAGNWSFSLLILDEVHNIKNPDNLAHDMIAYLKRDGIVLVSATPGSQQSSRHSGLPASGVPSHQSAGDPPPLPPGFNLLDLFVCSNDWEEKGLNPFKPISLIMRQWMPRRTMFTEAKYPNGEELNGAVIKTIHVKLPERLANSTRIDPNQKKPEMSDFDAPSMRIETVSWRILQLIANDLRNVQMIRLAERKRAKEERKAAKEVRELPPEQEPEDPDWDDPTPITPPRTRQNGLMTRLIQKSAAVKGADNPKENKAIMGVQKVEQLITAGNNSMLSHIFHTSCLDKAEPPPASLIGWLNFFLAKAPAAAAVVFQAVKEICEPEKDGLPNCVFIVVDPPWVQQHLYAMLQLAGVKVKSQILGTFTPYSPTSASATKASTSETAAQVFRIRCNQPASRYLNEVLGLGPSGLLNNPTRAGANASSLIARYAINCPEQMGPLGNVKKWDILAACCRLAKGRHLGVPFEPNEVKEYPTVNANNVEDIRKSIKKQAQDMETKQKPEKRPPLR